LNKYMKCNFRG